MGIYDVDLIMSWTPNEYKAFRKGAALKVVDKYEDMANAAVFNRIATNKKKLNVKKDLFDAKTARERIINGEDDWKESKEMDATRYKQAQSDMKEWASQFAKKG